MKPIKLKMATKNWKKSFLSKLLLIILNNFDALYRVQKVEEVKEEKIETNKEKQEGEAKSDEEPEIDPDELFKGKRVKEFICFELHQMKDQL